MDDDGDEEARRRWRTHARTGGRRRRWMASATGGDEDGPPRADGSVIGGDEDERAEESRRTDGQRCCAAAPADGRWSDDGSATGRSEAAGRWGRRLPGGGRDLRRPRRGKNWYAALLCSLCCYDSIYKREWVWGLEMPPPGARQDEAPRGSATTTMRVAANLDRDLLCYHVTNRGG